MPDIPAAPVTIQTAHDQVYRHVRGLIASGALTPGSKISIRMVADLCSVSATPVREALKQLQADGMIIAERRTLRVTRLDATQIHQVFEIRLRLEQLASEWAIAAVDATDIAELEAILERMSTGDIDAATWRELNQEFHRRFYDCTRSAPLLDLIQTVWDRVEPYLAIYASSVDAFDEAHRQHLSLLECIRERDLDRLLAEIAHHLRYTEETVLRAVGDGTGLEPSAGDVASLLDSPADPSS